jgi:hypothetical protein
MVKLFGSTISETINAFKSVHLGGANQTVGTSEDRIKAISRMIISILLIFLATYLFSSNNKETGSTIIGALIGYWIK